MINQLYKSFCLVFFIIPSINASGKRFSMSPSGGDVSTSTTVTFGDDQKVNISLYAYDSGTFTGDQFAVYYEFKGDIGDGKQVLYKWQTPKIYINSKSSLNRSYTLKVPKLVFKKTTSMTTHVWWAWDNAPVDDTPHCFTM